MTTSDPSSSYFTANPPPSALARHTPLAREFINHHVEASPSRKLVLITSGGTTVPLENQTVRFIDNFSAGTRGATSAEYFLREGYAVIFMHRQYSLLPFSRHYSHSTNCFLDFMDEGFPAEDTGNSKAKGPVVVKEEYQEQMRAVLREYQAAKRDRMLLLLPFTTITEYLYELKTLADLMKPLGSRAVFYLAAAVSDFFIPRDRMEEHKIQSSDITGSGKGKQLRIDLDPVPKFLSPLVNNWAPSGSLIVSFKLETDPNLLVSKAEQALEKYGHNLVIGNLLTTRKWEVVFISREEEAKVRWIRVPKSRRSKSFSGVEQLVGQAEGKKDETEVDLNGGKATEGMEIESLIVPELVAMHNAMIHKGQPEEP
ncbi:putative phosphopantothenate-cysteine ligase [Phaeomoniella chlamydospora]|uniref:Putative phosphopantothenate-cysteine ligase n=1 Tax=Phaeomoniella chlamydospora TaxID=158046 RepID=A0A0G2EBR7_PHACM|nr:putative phosphopantothenate-cysteine ligase [Phaeomoniella chlamydospora]